ncbi:putative Rho GTPase activating protein 15, partial [Operophtera brumata]
KPLTKSLYEQIYFPFHIENRQRLPGTARARTCELLLLADKEFFEKDANSSLNHVVRRMMHAVAQADIIFRNSDFNEDGVPDNIGKLKTQFQPTDLKKYTGFSVKYILVLTSEETNSRIFGDLSSTQVDGQEYLLKFTRLRRLSDVCLGVAFSGHAFINMTLGLRQSKQNGTREKAVSSRRNYERLNWSPTAEKTRVELERSFCNADSPRVNKRLGGSTENLLIANARRPHHLQLPASSSGDSLDVEIRGEHQTGHMRSRKVRSMVHRRSPGLEGPVKRTKFFENVNIIKIVEPLTKKKE